jgi:enoyl-CoA hydratase
MNPIPTADALDITFEDGVAQIRFNRPDKANALDAPAWQALRQAMHWLDTTPEAHVGVLAANGTHFCAGIDLSMLHGITTRVDPCDGRQREALRRTILDLQDVVTSIERCRKPVIAAIHGACVGAGVDIVTACDFRHCSADAFFAVKEVDVGLVADVGTLQRLPRLVGDGMCRELAYTGRRVAGAEAERIRLVNACHASAEALHAAVCQLAHDIAAKSPLVIRGTKEMLGYAREHGTADALNHVATWNAAMLLSEDLSEALAAARDKRKPRFRD